MLVEEAIEKSRNVLEEMRQWGKEIYAKYLAPRGLEEYTHFYRRRDTCSEEDIYIKFVFSENGVMLYGSESSGRVYRLVDWVFLTNRCEYMVEALRKFPEQFNSQLSQKLISDACRDDRIRETNLRLVDALSEMREKL